MSIIEELYNGTLAPIENMVSQDPRYRQICGQIGDDRKYFEKILSENDREKFQRWNHLIYEYEKMLEYTNFSSGFRLGMQMGCEVFGQEGEEDNLEEKLKRLEKWSLQKKETEDTCYN